MFPTVQTIDGEGQLWVLSTGSYDTIESCANEDGKVQYNGSPGQIVALAVRITESFPEVIAGYWS